MMLAACGDKVLYSKLSEQEANEMLSVLAASGIDARKVTAEDQSWNLETAEENFATANRVLKEQGLPQTKFASMGDIFKKDSLMSTRNEERMRYIHAMSQELSKTLSLIDGVIAVRVQPVIPASDPMTDKILPSSASVFIKHRADVDLRPRTQAIKELVMASIEGLQYDKIALSFFPASVAEVIPVRTQEDFMTRWGGLMLSTLVGLCMLCVGLFMVGKKGLVEGFAKWRSRLRKEEPLTNDAGSSS
ncbi:MAG: type III secretion inner membrane ring lipoprotein SctJ [Rhizobacter sp.]